MLLSTARPRLARHALACRRTFSAGGRSPLAMHLRYSHTTASSSALLLLGGGALALTTMASLSTNNHQRSALAAARTLTTSGDVITTGTPVKEKATGILFPQLCNGFTLAGCGVRIKYGLIKVYALGSYFDPLAMSAIKKADRGSIAQALLNPTYPRTIRIVMARGLSMEKFTTAIIEALEPRMKGQDLDRLEEFKKLNPPLDLVKGAEIQLTIRGDTLLYRNAVGGVGTIRSEVFTTAMCDVFYGEAAVSPTHKDSVLDGIPKL
jgi:hypothetical protein